jgi:maleylpyruvate isomerase
MSYAMTLDAIRVADVRLLAELDEGWTEAEVREPSLLPGWTRAHVLAHLALNGEATASSIEGAVRGEVVERYPGPPGSRDAAIAAGAEAPAEMLIANVRSAAERFAAAVEAGDRANIWDNPSSEGRRAGEWPLRRWQEVEVHHIDLAGEFGPADWPAMFLEHLLPQLANAVGPRSAVPVRIVLEENGSTSPRLAGREWATGGDDAVEVRARDWVVLTWLIGRPQAAGLLQPESAPPLTAW